MSQILTIIGFVCVIVFCFFQIRVNRLQIKWDKSQQDWDKSQEEFNKAQLELNKKFERGIK